MCDPIDGCPPGSPVPGILQARTLEWVAISFFNAWKWKVKVKSLSHVRPSTWRLINICWSSEWLLEWVTSRGSGYLTLELLGPRFGGHVVVIQPSQGKGRQSKLENPFPPWKSIIPWHSWNKALSSFCSAANRLNNLLLSFSSAEFFLSI